MAAYMPASLKSSEFTTHGESAYGQMPFSFQTGVKGANGATMKSGKEKKKRRKNRQKANSKPGNSAVSVTISGSSAKEVQKAMNSYKVHDQPQAASKHKPSKFYNWFVHLSSDSRVALIEAEMQMYKNFVAALNTNPSYELWLTEKTQNTQNFKAAKVKICETCVDNMTEGKNKEKAVAALKRMQNPKAKESKTPTLKGEWESLKSALMILYGAHAKKLSIKAQLLQNAQEMKQATADIKQWKLTSGAAGMQEEAS